jgi:methylated-DNA-[protein]-cysteine S-methyltransferase
MLKAVKTCPPMAEMQKTMKYTIFKTKWGYFGLAATDNGLLRTCLPLSNPEKVKRRILTSFVGREPSIKHRASLVRRSFGEGGSIEFDKDLFKSAQEQITAYFEGNCVDFKDVLIAHCHSREIHPQGSGNPDGVRIDFRNVPVVLNGLSVFAKRVLTACRGIRFGQTVSYGRLAEMAGKPGAARAVGRILAKNPLPLIIPCHRVICTNGSLGGFSATGGVKLKKRMLKLEGQL